MDRERTAPGFFRGLEPTGISHGHTGGGGGGRGRRLKSSASEAVYIIG
jgi:hypothetical protein